MKKLFYSTTLVLIFFLLVLSSGFSQKKATPPKKKKKPVPEIKKIEPPIETREKINMDIYAHGGYVYLTPINPGIKKYTENFQGGYFEIGTTYYLFGLGIFLQHSESSLSPKIPFQDEEHYFKNNEISFISENSIGLKFLFSYPIPFINYVKLNAGIGGTAGFLRTEFIQFANNHMFLSGGITTEYRSFLLTIEYKRTSLNKWSEWNIFYIGGGYGFSI